MKLTVLSLAFFLSLPAAADLPVRAPAPVVHFELAVKNLEAAKAFYSDLFAWTYESVSIPDYAYIEVAEGGIGGGFRVEPTQVEGFQGTTIYVQVDSLKKTLDHARRLGSTVIVPPIVISQEIGSIAVITDLDRNVIGLFSKETSQ